MKRSRLSYDEWKCITAKKLKGKQVDTDFFKGYIGLLEIEKVTEKQVYQAHNHHKLQKVKVFPNQRLPFLANPKVCWSYN